MGDRFPRLLLRAEGLVVAVAAIAVYLDAGYRWWLLLALALAPDLSFAAYAAGPRVGAPVYNALHAYVLPVALAGAGVLADADTATEVGLIWLTHIGVDRALGYGLKYPTHFRDTHLQRV